MTADRPDTATATDRDEGRVATVRGARRAMIVAVVGSLVVASAMGIVALLSGEFGDLQGRIVLTTLVVAAFGTTALCHLAVVTRAVRVVGFVGLAGSVGAAACALVLIWRDWDVPSGGEEGLFKALIVLTILAVSLAHANLLLLLSGRRHAAIRIGLAVTLIAIAVVAVMIVIPVLTDGEVPGSDDGWYWRWLGVAGIVDALGTIALPVLGLVLRPPRTDPPGPASWADRAGRADQTERAGPADRTQQTGRPWWAGQQTDRAGQTVQAERAGQADRTARAVGPAGRAGQADQTARTGDQIERAGQEARPEQPRTVRLVLDLPPDLAARLDEHAGGGSWENAALDVLHRGLP
ncbi:hypothetical protein H7X46_15485 [Pseudonocardia sp. C8]|uniref:hypothetical protein n=1 Tax=Pseudonocardia sp. C8 TaxID=2762759 RepID=UPI00164269E8|nr:hypothetical protein [Pseudonocardia sp. C8]MBC3192467.1 hypothetical protein [Pseudonocardia sp. C8]